MRNWKKEKGNWKWEMQNGKILHQVTTTNIFNWSLTYSWCNIGPQCTDIQRSSEIKMIPHRVNTIRRENIYRKDQLGGRYALTQSKRAKPVTALRVLISLAQLSNPVDRVHCAVYTSEVHKWRDNNNNHHHHHLYLISRLIIGSHMIWTYSTSTNRIHRMHKWRLNDYSFIWMLIRLTSLIFVWKFFCIFRMLTRLVRLISTKIKE